MARINHKLVMQRLNEKRSKITDRQFFTSRLMGGYFEDLAAAMTRRYHFNRRIRVVLLWKPKEPFFAETNNLVIRINAGHPIVTKTRGRENRFQLIMGAFTHELGHVLYTNFLAGQTHVNYLAAYRWYPSAPDLKTLEDVRNEKDFWEYVKDDSKNLEIVQYLAHYLGNLIDDGYVENRMLIEFPGKLGFGLEVLRDNQFKDMPTVTQLIEKEDGENQHIFESIAQMILSYVKFGEIKYGDEPLSDVRIQTLFGMISELDEALTCNMGKDRLKTVNFIMIRCWEYMREFCEVCKKRQEEARAAGGTESVTDILVQILKSIKGTSNAGMGSESPIAEGSGSGGGSVTAKARAKTHGDAITTESAANESSPQTEKESNEKSSESGEDSNDEEQEDVPVSGSLTAPGKQEVTSKEKGRIPYHQTHEIFTSSEGSVERDEEYKREQYEAAATDIERILNEMAHKKACEELENERVRELNESAQNISYGDVHSGINVRVNRIASVDEELVDQYNYISGPLLSISHHLQNSILKQLKEKRRGGKLSGLMTGSRLDTHALWRNDGKVFYNKSLPNEIPELAVGLLLDESGSMSSNDRSTYARAAAIILYDFCESLGIPVMVYGHSTGYDQKRLVELYSYAEFDGFDQDDKYRLMDIGSRGSNRDGAALRYVAEKLVKRPEEAKLLILVSDGQPADYGYSGTAAEEDLRGIKQEYKRKGIIFVAAAIGDDKKNIERIYGDSYLDITDLTQLPTKLTAVVKRHVRV
ncbi:MAG: VWA domain-containing protein [Lachnospiraceae bacterium]|nr:VWA domain-containing protein [Lachnospiraceae bacterium]